MEYNMEVTPDPYAYIILFHARCQLKDVDISILYGDDIAIKSSVKSSENEIWPNAKHCGSVLKAHAKTKSAGGEKKALGLLSETERRFYAADT